MSRGQQAHLANTFPCFLGTIGLSSILGTGKPAQYDLNPDGQPQKVPERV